MYVHMYAHLHSYILDPSIHGQDSQLLQPEQISWIYTYSCILQMNSRNPIFLDPRLLFSLVLTFASHLEITESTKLNTCPLTKFNRT